MKTLYLLLFLFTCMPVENWTGYTFQEQKQHEIDAKIRYLKKKYPPDERDWCYDISQQLT